MRRYTATLLVFASLLAAVAAPVGAAKEAAPAVAAEVPRLGYDLVLVVDTTACNQIRFRPAAPPHPPSNRLKNPLGLDVAAIFNLAEERNIRFIVFKIGLGDDDELRALASHAKAATQGRFRLVNPVSSLRRELLDALNEEWDLLEKGNQAVRHGITHQLP